MAKELSAIPLVLQTAYAELLERCAIADFEQAFEGEGAFAVKTVSSRRYWYFQTGTKEGRQQRYVGPETQELLARIARHRQWNDDQRERRALVSVLVRSVLLPRLNPEMGMVLTALARAGIFRLRAVLVGTVAFQAYSAMLGVRLPHAAAQTGDVDIAQDRNISVAVEDRTPPILDTLRRVDPAFRPVATPLGDKAVSYVGDGLRVDMLTPNRGAESQDPVALPSIGTHALQLRFLDFLIRNPEPAALLHDAGVHVLVPAPERYALHKLIVVDRRPAGVAKAEKDLHQASVLLAVLAKKRPGPLRDIWDEAVARGKKWRQAMLESMAKIDPRVRDDVLRIVELPRSTVHGISLDFADAPPRYDFDRSAILYEGKEGTRPSARSVRCAISQEALEDHYGGDDAGGLDHDPKTLNKNRLIKAFRKHRMEIEALTKLKYLEWPVEQGDFVLIRTEEISELRRRAK